MLTRHLRNGLDCLLPVTVIILGVNLANDMRDPALGGLALVAISILSTIISFRAGYQAGRRSAAPGAA